MKLRLQKDWNIWGNKMVVLFLIIFKLVIMQLMFFCIFVQ